MIEYVIIGFGIICVIGFFVALALYKTIPPSEAHVVVTPFKTMVCSADSKIADACKAADKSIQYGGRWYFQIPVIREVRIMDMTIKELLVAQETYEKDQARYQVKSSTKYRIVDVATAAETFQNDQSLKEQLTEVIKAGVREVTVKYDVTEARAKKQLMAQEIKSVIHDDLNQWGLELNSFQLVDFEDTDDSQIISNISKRREVEIEATTRERNAEKVKQARVKEAEAEETAKQREIAKDEKIGMREQDKAAQIAEQEKIAQEKEYAVKEVQVIRQTEIEKGQAKIQAEQEKEVASIMKEKKRLEGEGEKLRDIEKAKGQASYVKESGFAEAEVLNEKQKALNQFGDKAVRALVAEKIVDAQKIIGVEGAKALAQADLKVFSGGGAGEAGFDLGQLIGSTAVASDSAAKALLNKVAQPNDLGFTKIPLGNDAPKDKPKVPRKD